MVIRKEDIRNEDIIDAIELGSDGYYVYFSTTIVSTNSSGLVTINLDIDNLGITSLDHYAKPNDRVYLTGTSGGLGDGYFLILTIDSDTTFTVSTSIGDSTGGTIYFMHPAGAKNIGFDPIGLSITSAKNLQDAVYDIANNGSGISASTHKTIRQLIHFIDNGPADGFASGAYKEILPAADPFPTSIIWWTSSSKTNKIVEKTITYNSNKTPDTISWKMYDESNNLLTTVTDAIVYSGVFELNRTRTIV